MQPFGQHPLFCWNCVSVFLTARTFEGTAISIGIGNIYKLYACLGGAQVGIESMIGSAPPLTVLFGHLQEQIVLTEPL